jgi:hypothetical protein
MAIGIGGKLVEQDDSVYLSDESNFYGPSSPLEPFNLSSCHKHKADITSGDEATKRELEGQANDFSVTEWWTYKTPSLTQIANSNLASEIVKEAVPLYNPYEGRSCGRQLGETVAEFLQRLPPATTQPSSTIPWIFIANPFRKAPNRAREGNSPIDEGPPDEESHWARFVVRAGRLLEELTGVRHEIEKQRAGQPKGTITKAINVQKDSIVKKIIDTAVGLRCTSGKVRIPDRISQRHY